MTIANGMLRKINIDQPSQFLGFISIPVDMVKAIAAIPGSILSMKIQNTQDQASLYKAQTDLLTPIAGAAKNAGFQSDNFTLNHPTQGGGIDSSHCPTC